MLAWESLVTDPRVAGHRNINPEGINMATQCNAEIESGDIAPIDHVEFLRRTRDVSE